MGSSTLHVERTTMSATPYTQQTRDTVLRLIHGYRTDHPAVAVRNLETGLDIFADTLMSAGTSPEVAAAERAKLHRCVSQHSFHADMVATCPAYCRTIGQANISL